MLQPNDIAKTGSHESDHTGDGESHPCVVDPVAAKATALRLPLPVDQRIPFCEERTLNKAVPMPPEDEVVHLPPAQRAAASAIIAGRSFASAARSAGVTRQTLYNWQRNDAVFRAALQAYQANALESARSRLIALTDQCVTTVGLAIARGDTRLAMQLLDKLPVLRGEIPRPPDSCEVAVLIESDRRDGRMAAYRRNKSSGIQEFNEYGYSAFADTHFADPKPGSQPSTTTPPKGPKA